MEVNNLKETRLLEFNAEVTRLLNDAYQGADLTRRRQASFDALKPSPGDTIIDIGCGNGLLTAELARAVGPTGKIIGVDPSEDMLKAGKKRCQGHENVEFAEGVADNLPVSDGTADKAVSVQVFEYIDDVENALDDAMRCWPLTSKRPTASTKRCLYMAMPGWAECSLAEPFRSLWVPDLTQLRTSLCQSCCPV